MSTIERICEFAESQQISIRSFEKKISASNGLLRKAITNKTDIQSKWLSLIVDNFPQLSEKWLLTGKGSMLHKPSDDKPPMTPTAAPPTITPEQMQAVAVLKEIISEQNAAISSLNQDVGELKSNNKYMSQKIKDLSVENERLKSENAGLKNEVESLKKAEYERKHAMAEPKGNDMQVYDVPTQPYTALLAAAEPHVDYHRQRPGTK